VPIRAPHLRDALRAFCLAAFAQLGPELEQGQEIPFALERSATGFTEYRPLIGDHVRARAYSLSQLEDARIALDELERDPAARLFAAGHAGAAEERALFRAILMPLLTRTAEACGGFDWEDGAFERVYGELERSLYGTNRSYRALAPLVGLSVGVPIALVRGLRVHETTADEICARWPEARELLPSGFGQTPERTCVLALERELPGGEESPPDAPAELADAVTALRLATGAPVAAGPVVFERLDTHPFGVRPLLGIAATEPAGEPTRLDPWRGKLAADLLARLAVSEDDSELGEALERWELSLFEDDPLRSERLREALAALLGGADGLWAAAMRAAVLVGDPGPARAGLVGGLRALARGETAHPGAAEVLRRAFVEAILHEDRDRLIAGLDDALLGLRARPPGYFSFRHESGSAA
jgi:hypothetical protein